MRKFGLTLIAASTVLFVGTLAWTASATVPGSTLNPPTTANSPVENIACWCGPYRCACGWRRWNGRRCIWRGGVRICRW